MKKLILGMLAATIVATSAFATPSIKRETFYRWDTWDISTSSVKRIANYYGISFANGQCKVKDAEPAHKDDDAWQSKIGGHYKLYVECADGKAWELYNINVTQLLSIGYFGWGWSLQRISDNGRLWAESTPTDKDNSVSPDDIRVRNKTVNPVDPLYGDHDGEGIPSW